MTDGRTGAAAVRSYNQNCPIALGMDVLGDRWTLLILREMVGGPRRYVDIRAELPGIATNLLAERLREEILGAYLKDNVKARVLQADGRYVRAPRDGEPFCAQEHLMQLSLAEHPNPQ